MGDYERTLFAITSNGTLYAIDTQLAAGVDASNAGSGYGHLAARLLRGRNPFASHHGNVVGLAFSPLDFNLWHPTIKREADAGHGINAAPDNSRTPAEVDSNVTDPGRSAVRDSKQNEGGASLHFGFEQIQTTINNGTSSYLTYMNSQTQLGILNTEVHSDLSSNAAIRNTYNMPAGAWASCRATSSAWPGTTPKTSQRCTSITS